VSSAPLATTHLLLVNDLACERDDRCLYQQLSFTLKRGDLWHVKGQNGAGKTTLLRQLAGLHSVDTGKVQWCEPKAKILYLGHKLGLKEQLTANENLSWLASLSTGSTQEQRYKALETVGLRGFEENLVSHLSAGQKRRVALARLQLCPADVWFLDEPFTSLDQQGIIEEQAWLQTHIEQGGAVLMTSHQDLNLPQIKVLDLSLHVPQVAPLNRPNL
jgi:heme exporter protein A